MASPQIPPLKQQVQQHIQYHIQQRANDNWLIGCSSNQWAEQVEHWQRILRARDREFNHFINNKPVGTRQCRVPTGELALNSILAPNTANPPRIVLAESDPTRFLAGLIAAAAADGSVFLTHPNQSGPEWDRLLNLVDPDLIWGRERGTGNGERGTGRRAEGRGQKAEGRRDEICNLWGKILVPTGGSSGQVRFAIHTWETLMASVTGFKQYFQLASVNSYCVLPLYHVSGLMQFLRSFTSGGRLAIQSFKDLAAGKILAVDPAEFFISLVPTQLQRLLDRGMGGWLSQFHMILLGGAPAWPDLLAQAQKQQLRLAPTYGMTETASQIATLKPKHFLRGDRSCGQVLPHAKVMILDPEGRELEVDRVGAIAIQASSLALGYYPPSPPFDPTLHPYFQTDDLGFLDRHHHLHITGRSSDKIITGGENVFPAEIEAVIRASHLVVDVCVFGIPSPQWGQAIVAAYIPINSAVSIAQLKDAIADRLSPFKRPKHWVAVKQLPRNAQGKLNRTQIAQMVQDPIIS